VPLIDFTVAGDMVNRSWINIHNKSILSVIKSSAPCAFHPITVQPCAANREHYLLQHNSISLIHKCYFTGLYIVHSADDSEALFLLV
jgi:hypothetical protein